MKTIKIVSTLWSSLLLFTLLFNLSCSSAFSQSPQKISYQAIIRDASNKLLVNQVVGMQISILQGSATGTAVYTETQRPVTNGNGLVSIEIGSGQPVLGDFSSIDWGKGPHFIKTETDPTGGSDYTITGSSQLLGVPYAFYATTAESLTNPAVETDPRFSAWDKSSGIRITESQITDLDHFTNAEEKDPKYSSDSSFIKTGVRSWNRSIAKTIDAADTTHWGKAETDPVFSAWNKSSGITITESQISDLDHFKNSDETDPTFRVSVAKGITTADTSRWNRKGGFSGNYQDLINKPTNLSNFTNDMGFQRSSDDGDISSTNEIQNLFGFPTTKTITLSQGNTLYIPDYEGDPRYVADSSFIKTGTRSWNSSLAKTIDAGDTLRWGRAETDPYYMAWDKSSGIHIVESQITDLDHFTTADEIDPRYATDSSFIKTGTRSWNSSLAKTIDAGDTLRWGRAETDPYYMAWDKSSGIHIVESQITDLDHFTNADEIDPRYAADSSFIKSGVRVWNSSLAKTIDVTDTTYWGRAETDPHFNAWDKHTGISITESQITDLDHFTTGDEIDPRYAADSTFIKSGVRGWNSSLAKTIDAADTTHWGKAETDPPYSADSSFIKSGVRSWNGSLAKTIDAADTTHWGRAETDPVFDAWDKSTDIVITESQISDLNHFTNSDETDQVYSADSSFIKSAVRDWNGSPAKTITSANITTWNNKSDFNGNYSSLTNAPDIANSTNTKTINLSSNTNSSSLTVNNIIGIPLLKVQGDGLTGINNVSSPRASLEVGGYDGLLVTGERNIGTVRALGAGMRMHWYPQKGAFRVGLAETTYWDDDGSITPKLAPFSYGIGYQVRATAIGSYALGTFCHATGDYSLSMGNYSEASGYRSIAIGNGDGVGWGPCRASGIYSIALGQGADTDYRDGSMVIGDDSYFQTAKASADNQLTMRFSGGYRLWTYYPDSTSGVYMRHGANGWSAYCDRNKKTNFEKLDFEEVLKKIDEMPVTRWNYKGIDTMKYIGPMAQDFYAAFQLGGTDSLGINTICIDGVNMAAIKGLIDRTDLLKTAIEELKTEQQKNAELESLYKEQSELIKEMRKELDEMKAEVSKSAIKSKDPITAK